MAKFTCNVDFECDEDKEDLVIAKINAITEVVSVYGVESDDQDEDTNDDDDDDDDDE